MPEAEDSNNTTARWRTFDQSLDRIRQGRPDITEELAWRELRVEIDLALWGMSEGVPIDKFRYPWAGRMVDLVVLFRNKHLAYEDIQWQKVKCNQAWLERRWPLPALEAEATPAQSASEVQSETLSSATQPSERATADPAPSSAPVAGGLTETGSEIAARESVPESLASEEQPPSARSPVPSIEPGPRAEPTPPSNPIGEVGDQARDHPQQSPETRGLASVDMQPQPQPPVPKLRGKQWVPVAYARRPDALLAMGITGASRVLAEESKTALDCAKPLTARYIEKLLRESGAFPKAPRGSKQRPK